MDDSAGDPDLRRTLLALGEDEEVTIDSGLVYRGDEPVIVRVRRRGHRYDIDDAGAAITQAGKPDGWLSVTERLVAEVGFNVNRRGVVFVPAVEGRDIASLALGIARTSRDVYLGLLESASA